MSEEVIVDNKPKVGRPKVSRSAQSELDKVEKQFEKFDEEVKEKTLDRMNMTPKSESESPLAQAEINKSKDIYLKPRKILFSPRIEKSTYHEKFNEKFRKDYNFLKEYVQFIAENKEIAGEAIEIWTKPFPGVPAEEWLVPVNKPVWGPRYLAEQIKRKYYHRLGMDESKTTSSDGRATYYGQMTVDTTIQRLDAHPVNTKKSIFMGGNF